MNDTDFCYLWQLELPDLANKNIKCCSSFLYSCLLLGQKDKKKDTQFNLNYF